MCPEKGERARERERESERERERERARGREKERERECDRERGGECLRVHTVESACPSGSQARVEGVSPISLALSD